MNSKKGFEHDYEQVKVSIWKRVLKYIIRKKQFKTPENAVLQS
jgi:hypothetical protein